MPPALTTISVSIDPLSVWTPRTRPRSTPIAGDARRCVDLGAAVACALRQRERQLARVDVAVGRKVGGAEHAVRRHRREEALRLVGRDRARAGGRTSSPSRPGARAPPCAPPRTQAGASRPRASRSRARPRPRASGRGRPSSSSSSSGSSDPRSWPTSPAEWNVEPLVRSARSTRTTSSQPSCVEPVEDRRAADAAADHDGSRSGHSCRQRFAEGRIARGLERVGRSARPRSRRSRSRARRSPAGRRPTSPRGSRT